MGVDASRLRKGMKVRNPNGQRIGRVVGVQPGWIRIKQGRILPDEFWASVDDVEAIREGEIVLQLRGTIPGERNQGRNSGSRGLDVARRMHDTRLL